MKHESAIAASLEAPIKLYTLDDGHVLRSRAIDAFSRLERVIADKARTAGNKVTRATPVSDYLQELAKADFKSPTKAKQKIEHAQKLLSCRNDIVHSELEIMECSGAASGTFYVFQNVSLGQETIGRSVRLISASELEELPSIVKKLANELKQQQFKGEASIAPASATA